MPTRTYYNDKIHRRKLEYNLVDHCNLACKECSHLSPFQEKGSGSLTNFERDVKQLSSVYHVDRFRFVGGEPLLNQSILEFIAVVRDARIADFVEIVTNGTLLSRTPDDVFAAVDGISISWYPSSWSNDSALSEAKSRCRRLGVRLKVDRIDRFRKMQPQHPHSDDLLIKKIYRSCLIANTWDCQTIYNGHFYVCSRPIYTRSYYEKLGHDAGDLRSVDGVYLHAPRLRERIERALHSTEPLASCRYCLGTVGVYQKWGQLSPKERRSPVQLVDTSESDLSILRMRYLLLWRDFERLMLRLFPSDKVQRLLARLLAATIRD